MFSLWGAVCGGAKLTENEIRERLQRGTSTVLNYPIQQKDGFFSWAVEEWTKTMAAKYKNIPQKREELFSLALAVANGAELANIKKIAHLTEKGREIFFILSILLQGRGITQHILNLSIQEKDKILQSAFKNWEDRVIVAKLPLRKKQEIDRLLAGAVVGVFFPLFGSLIPHYTQTIIYKTAIKSLIENTQDLSGNEKTFLLNFFSNLGPSKKAPDNEVKSVNKTMYGIFKSKNPYISPTYQQAERLFKKGKEIFEAAWELLGEFRGKYTKKQFWPEHIILIEKAIPEIELIDQAVKGEAYKAMAPEKRKDEWEIPRWKKGIKDCLEKNKFMLIKPEYLEPDKFYQKLLGGGKKKNFRQELYGWIMNRIFEGKQLDTFDSKVIYKVIPKKEKL